MVDQQQTGIILVAEDHRISQQVAQLYLNELGFACHIVNNGREVVEAVNSAVYAVVLMDCQMPEMDGFDATIAIRKNEATSGRHIPIIAMTANSIEEEEERCLVAGMDDYLCKPVKPAQLNQMLHKWIPAEAPPEQLPPQNASQAYRENGVGPGPEFDVEDFRHRFKSARARTLLALFLEQMPVDLQKLQQAVKSADGDSLKQTAHALRGVFCVIGVEDMTELCTLIEQEVQDNRWDLAGATLHEFERQLRPLLIEVENELALMPG